MGYLIYSKKWTNDLLINKDDKKIKKQKLLKQI